MKTLILIPVRMASVRFPNKPMALIDGKPMIQRVWEKAIQSKVGDVIVACADKEIFNLIKSLGGNAEMTDPKIKSGTDRIYAAINNYANLDQIDSIINLQGDMPLIDSDHIKQVNVPLKQGFDIGTLVTDLQKNQINNNNITKAKIDWINYLKIGHARNFFKTNNDKSTQNIYHHVGIYSFKFSTLKKFVKLPQSKNEINLKLEQMRALDGKMTIGATYVKNVPISVDTKDDLFEIEGIIGKNAKR
tara:strand:+ start:582 stop:1319 length:738 start_codon:yes stop_codon:yes gene_type:complete